MCDSVPGQECRSSSPEIPENADCYFQAQSIKFLADGVRVAVGSLRLCSRSGTAKGFEKKLERLSLSLHRQKTTTVPLPENLYTHKEALLILAGALEILRKAGQDKLELQLPEDPWALELKG